MNRAEIEDGLRRLGVRRNDVLEVHSSLSSLGHVERGAAAVVDALMGVVGPEGGLVMSAYPVSPPLPLTEIERARGITWKVRILPDGSHERSGLGAVVEEFCRRPGVVLGQGLHRVAAWGRDAQRLSQGYQELLAAEGRVLLIGVGIDRCSSMHLAEAVPIPDEIASIFKIPETIRRDYPSAVWDVGYFRPGGRCDDAWQKVQQKAERRGLIQHGRIGLADCMLFPARAIIEIYAEWRRNDPHGLFGV